MKVISNRFVLLSIVVVGLWNPILGQIAVSLTVNDATINTTCTDLITAPDPFWELNVENEGWLTYPETGNCFTALPNEQYRSSFDCGAALPTTIEVCFRVFENDDVLFELGTGCAIIRSCEEMICQDFMIPAFGTQADYSLSLPNGLTSEGTVNFTINTGLEMGNDQVCGAIDLGTIDYNTILGDKNAGIYNNICATNTNDPDPGRWNVDAGVWFSFLTSDNPGNNILVDVLSDPEGTGDDIDIEIGAYFSIDGQCDGQLVRVDDVSQIRTLDGRMELLCLRPNTRYYLMVDGAFATPTSDEGVFSIQLTSIGFPEAGDDRCDAEDLGAVPEGGFVSTPDERANFCARSINDPFNPAFVTQTSVWFRFEAPPSGHVIIEGIPDTDRDSIGIQMGLYRSINRTCTGFFSHVQSQFTAEDLGETMEATCLFPGTPYWIMIDGSGSNGRGAFSVVVRDAGDITPRVTVDTTICAGATYRVGGSNYTESGSYADTLRVFAGCDSIVFSNVTVLPEIQVEIEPIQPGVGVGEPNGIAEVSASGSTGNFSYLWCNGETSIRANNLVGGEECCVTVTDDRGCEVIECFDVDLVIDLVPSVSGVRLLCNGDQDGTIRFSTINGLPPYDYTWQNADNSLNGSGVIDTEGEEVLLENLPAGEYTISILDDFHDTTFMALVTQPDPLEILVNNVQDASCFSFCDGRIEIDAQGGTGNYQWNWEGGTSSNNILPQICAGAYQVTVIDENNCQTTMSFEIGEPAEFIVTAEQVQAVSCFGGDDGQIMVSTNGIPMRYNWSNGANTAAVNNLSVGFYDVTVTNADGCEDITSVEVTQPDAPLEVEIQVQQDISCFGGSDGILEALVSGPATTIDYNWSVNTQQPTAEGLAAGTYSIVVTNELGCEAMTTFLLDQPEDLVAELQIKNINCLDDPNGGLIEVINTRGGIPDYQYSLDGILFNASPVFPRLFEGSYEVVVMDAAGCEKNYAAVVEGPPELIVDLGEDLTIQQGAEIELEALVNSDNVLYTWQPVDSVVTSGKPTLIVGPVETTAFQVFVRDTTTFCTAEDLILINVKKDRKVFIPSAFSPNQDENNEVFMIFGGLGIAQVKSFRVFSRTGNMVFQATDFQPNDPTFSWDGNFNGQRLNTGVYVYSAEIEFVDGFVEVFKGDVVLMR